VSHGIPSTCCNIQASTVVTAVLSLTMRYLIPVGGTVYAWPLKCHHSKKFNNVSLVNPEGHAVSPSCSVHLPGYITLNIYMCVMAVSC
jgi:hypothetical protein